MSDDALRKLERELAAVDAEWSEAASRARAAFDRAESIKGELRRIRHRAEGCTFDITLHCIHCTRGKNEAPRSD